MNDNNPIKFRNDKEAEYWSSAWDASKAAKFDSGFCTDAADLKIKDMRQRMSDPTASIKPEAPVNPITPPPNERPALERVKTAILHELHSGNFTSGLSSALWAVEMELYHQPEPTPQPNERPALERLRKNISSLSTIEMRNSFTNGYTGYIEQERVLRYVDNELAKQPSAELPPTVKAIIEDVPRISSQWEGSRPQLPSSIIDWLSRTQARLAALDRGE